jgi:hypothetical protein
LIFSIFLSFSIFSIFLFIGNDGGAISDNF